MSMMISDMQLPDQELVNAVDRDIAMVNPEDPAIVHRLVTGLIYAFDLQSEVDLSFVLGHGECESNEDALTAWVMDQLDYTDWVEPGVLFNDLAYQLQYTLKFWRATA
jgi:hypothetical protein